MSTARRPPKRPAVSDSSDDEHDIIDLCSVSSGDETVRVAGGSAAAVSDASVPLCGLRERGKRQRH